MKIEVTLAQVYNNCTLLNFFFRNQAKETFNKLFESVEESTSEIFDAIESYSDDLDEIEELFYSESIEDLCEIFGLTLMSEDEK
jgi:hypothetical protein